MWSPQCLLYESFLPSVHFEHFALISYILHFFFVIMEFRIFQMIVISANPWHYSSGHYFGFPLRTCLSCPPQNICKEKNLYSKYFFGPGQSTPSKMAKWGGQILPPSPSPGLLWSFNQCMQCIIPFSYLLRNQYFPW